MSLHSVPDTNSDDAGDTAAAEIIEGLTYTGEVVKVEPVRYRESQQIIEGLANLTMRARNGRDFKITLRRQIIETMGTVDLPAFDKLVNALPGQGWIVSLVTERSVSNGAAWTNFLAVDAVRCS